MRETEPHPPQDSDDNGLRLPTPGTTRRNVGLSPIALMTILAAAVFVGETGIMILIERFNELPWYVLSLIDAGALTLLSLPFFYFFFHRPLRSSVVQRTKALSELGESEERFRVIFNHVIDGTLVADVETKQLRAGNPKIRDMLQYSEEELRTMSMMDLHPPEDLAWIVEQFERQSRGEIELARDVPVLRKDGSRFYADINSGPMMLAGKRYVIGSFRNAESRRRIESALRARNEQMDVLLGAATRLNAVLEVPRVMRELVSSALALIGAESGAAGLVRDGQMVFEEYNDRGTLSPITFSFPPGHGVPGWVMQHVEPYLSDDAANDPVVIQEIREALGFRNLVDVPIISRSGELLGCFEIHNKLGGQSFALQDVELLTGLAAQAAVALENALLLAERARLEDNLRQSQKLQDIGQLAGGVAHDFNNLLQAILGHTELALSDGDVDAETRENLELSRKAASRAAELTGQLLAFARRQVLNPVDIDVNATVANLLTLLRRVLPPAIHVEFVPGKEAGVVCADPGQIEQVLMNLCVNARDAMPDGGTIRVATTRETVGASFATKHPGAANGSYARITVSDTGCGMDPETAAQAFEPFFTTKKTGRGTGLGLPVAYGIIQQHGGVIRLESEPDHGTTFEIYLPAVDRAAMEPPPEPVEMPPGGSETILIAEDDAIVREYVRHVLARAGYRVRCAADGADAVAMYESDPDEVALVMLDVLMPRLSGREAYERIRGINADVRVLFHSGFIDDTGDTGFIAREGLELLKKPYTRTELLRKVRQLLG